MPWEMLGIMGAARDELKQATSEAHRHLDENRLVAGLANGTLTETEYAGMLQGYLAFYAPWEEEMRNRFSALVAQAGPERFLKTQWLEKDLAALGLPAAAVAFAALPIPATLPGAAGALYVVEGSTMGGMHLSRSGRLPAHAQHFFTGYGSETMSRWKDLVALLDLLLPDEGSRQEAVKAATDTFAWFQSAFEEIASAFSRNSSGDSVSGAA